jgi:hypothetical protein
MKALARIVYLDAPAGESELEFWRRKAAERAKENEALRTQATLLRWELKRLREGDE